MPKNGALKKLPHREPFRFVREVVEISPGESALCRTVWAHDDPVFRGHFPGNPIVPGVLIAEALAQCAGLAAAEENRTCLLSAIQRMKFPRPARPDEGILLRATMQSQLGGLLQFEVDAKVNNQTVASGLITLAQIAAQEQER